MADIDETLKKAGWFEVAPGAGVWRAPDAADNPSGRKYPTYGAALVAEQQMRLKASEAKKARARKPAEK